MYNQFTPFALALNSDPSNPGEIVGEARDPGLDSLLR
jgi:hypothetical protein